MSLILQVAISEARTAQCTSAAVGAGEQVVLASQRDRPDGALDNVAVDLDAAVVEEAGKSMPARQGVADGLGQRRLAGYGVSCPSSQGCSASMIGLLLRWRARRRWSAGRPADVGFDGVEGGDAHARLAQRSA